MDLSTNYLGLKLANPIVAAASPLSKKMDTVKRLEESGAAAIVMYSLFEEQINHEKQELDHFLNVGTESFAEALDYFPEPDEFANIDGQAYLNHLESIKKAVNIPVIASLNGVSKGGWMEYAKRKEDAGADAIELNIFFVPTDPSVTAQHIEDNYIESLKAVKESVGIPVALKVGASFSAFANFAKRADEAGADGLVLFNRFFGPEIDIENLEVTAELELSHAMEKRLPLRWIAILHDNIKASLAASSGVHSAEDVIKMLMAGADAVMLASVLLREGPDFIGKIRLAMERWLVAHDYYSVEQMKGSMSYQSVAEPAAYERANYMRQLQSWE